MITPPASHEIISLIRQLDAELPAQTSLEILVPATLAPVDAVRPRLSRRVEWTVGVEAAAPRTAPSAPPSLTIRHAPGADGAERYFRAAATAWAAADSAPVVDVAETGRAVPAGARHLIWLAAGPVPDAVERWVRSGGVILTALDTRIPVESETVPVWRGMAGDPLAMEGRLGRGRVLRLTRALEPAAVPQLVEPDFPDSLLAMLAPSPPPERVAAADHTPLTGAAAYDQPPLDLRPWLGLLIALTFAGERWLASRRLRAVAP